MRIEADPGGMDSATFDGINGDISEAIAEFAGPLAAAEGGAGQPNLSSAISDLCANLRTADGSAALTLEGLSTAVAKAASHYSQTDANVRQAAVPRYYAR
jgi:hypothetical protein